MSAIQKRQWTEEELVRHLKAYLREKQERRRPAVDPFALVEWLVSNGLLVLERAVRRVVEFVFR